MLKDLWFEAKGLEDNSILSSSIVRLPEEIFEWFQSIVLSAAKGEKYVAIKPLTFQIITDMVKYWLESNVFDGVDDIPEQNIVTHTLQILREYNRLIDRCYIVVRNNEGIIGNE